MKTKNAGNLLIFLTAFLWSFLGIASKLVSVDPVVITGVTGSAAICVIRIFFRNHRVRVNRQTVIAGLLMAGTQLTFYLANRYTTVTNTIVLQYTSPIFVLLLNMLLQHYRPKKKEIMILAVCFAGMLIFFCDQLDGGQMVGNCFALTSGILFAGSFYFNAKPENDAPSSTIIAYVFCSVCGLTFMLGTGRYPVQKDMLILLGVGAVLTGFSGIAYAKGIALTSALTANMIALSEVFMAPVWAFLLFHEQMGRYSAVGMVLMLGAIVAKCITGNEDVGGENEVKRIEKEKSTVHHS